jgi:hypothetical protein
MSALLYGSPTSLSATMSKKGAFINWFMVLELVWEIGSSKFKPPLCRSYDARAGLAMLCRRGVLMTVELDEVRVRGLEISTGEVAWMRLVGSFTKVRVSSGRLILSVGSSREGSWANCWRP